MVIHIDPGTAFGTGMHETTQLCIRALKKYVTSETEILSCAAFSCWLDIYIRLDYILNLSVLHFKQLYIFPYEYENLLIGRAPLILRDKSYFI